MDPQDNHYTFLGLDIFARPEEVAAAVERLSKQANALANTSPARSHELRDQLRQVRQDLLTTEERRNAYDNALLDAQRRAGGPASQDNPFHSRMEDTGDTAQYARPGRGERARPTVASRYGQGATEASASSRGPRTLWLLSGVLVVVLLAGGGGFAVARGAFSPAPTATPMPSPTATPQPTALPTLKATATARPRSAVIHMPTPIPQPTLPVTNEAAVVGHAVADYVNARNKAFGSTHDTSDVDSRATGTAHNALMCEISGKSNSLENTNAYITYNPIQIGNLTVTINGSGATAAQYKEEIETVHHSDGTTDMYHNAYTVTYHLTKTSNGWIVDDYNWGESSGNTGGASKDASPCGG